MRDGNIRQAALTELRAAHSHDPDTLIIEELGLFFGDARVDIAVVNGSLHGLEIKSDRDSLHRLPNQVQVYSEILDHVTLVCGARHAAGIDKHIPDWWGITVAAKRDDGTVAFDEARPPRDNPGIKPLSLASLLWRDEALAVLEALGAARGVRGRSRVKIYQRLVETLPLIALAGEVRAALRRRQDWR